MISLHPGHRSKEVISNNCPKFCKGRKDLSSINTCNFPGFCLSGKQSVRSLKTYLLSLYYMYFSSLEGGEGQSQKEMFCHCKALNSAKNKEP